MLSFDEALERLLAAAMPVTETETVALAQARGRVLADDLLSPCAVPPHDNSAMDGYALRCADVPATGARLPVVQRIAAGGVGVPLAAGTAARIFTGAAVPPGADAVVMQERVKVDADGTLSIEEVPKAGQNIRRAGEDIASGACVLAAGTRLGAAEIGVAASVGVANLRVRRRLRVALLATGDELVEPGETLAPGCIYNSNRYFMRALLEGFGCEVIDLGRVADTLEATRAALRQAAAGNDLILSSGGVSVGEEDHVRAAVEAEGALELWKVAIKPGKPLAFGSVRQGTAFIGLPGNPVASYLTCLLLVRPFLWQRMGAHVPHVTPVPCIVASTWPKADPKRREFLRARRLADGRVELHPNQGSGVLTSCTWADGLIDNPPGRTFAPGDTVDFIAFADLTCA